MLFSIYKLNQSWFKVDKIILKIEDIFLLKDTF
jgi:hypothetical protein